MIPLPVCSQRICEQLAEISQVIAGCGPRAALENLSKGKQVKPCRQCLCRCLGALLFLASLTDPMARIDRLSKRDRTSVPNKTTTTLVVCADVSSSEMQCWIPVAYSMRTTCGSVVSEDEPITHDVAQNTRLELLLHCRNPTLGLQARGD